MTHHKEEIQNKWLSRMTAQTSNSLSRLTGTLSAADLSTETCLDGRDRTARTAGVASDEVQTVLTLVQFSIGAAASLAGDVFNWISR